MSRPSAHVGSGCAELVARLAARIQKAGDEMPGSTATTPGALFREPVEIDPAGPYFATGGERWFPSGWCCSNVDVLTSDDLRRMADAGCNTLRLWPDPNETARLPDRLPEVLGEASAVGIRCLITMLNPGELSDLFIDRPNLHRIANAYREICSTPRELIISGQARELDLRRIDRYLDVAGDSPGVWGWVVASQPDGVYQVPLQVLNDFVAEMAQYVRKEELRRTGRARPRAVTSFDPVPVWDAGYSSPELDMVGMHCYSAAIYAPVDGVQAAREVAAATAHACLRRAPGRPVYCMEYGSILHLFLPDEPPLPADLLRRWRRNTNAAHLCAGGAGGPLLVPPAVAGAMDSSPGVTGLADQVRSIPRAIPRALLGEERAFRRMLGDPLLQILRAEPAKACFPAGTVGVSCGAPGAGQLFWLAADTRVRERADLVRRARDGAADVTPLLGYDAGRALLETVSAPVCNPQSRNLIGKLMAAGLAEVAAERVDAELGKIAHVLRHLDLPSGPAGLGGIRLSLGASAPCRFRCYDMSTGEVALAGTARGELVLPELTETVIAVDPHRVT
jgi:hypothetical protein